MREIRPSKEVMKPMAQETLDSEWITVKEMQHLLSLGRSKTYEVLAQEEEIEVAQIGTAIRINKASLQRWIRKHRYPAWRQGASIADEGG
jgi:excisionase family DNA binding protein